MSNTQVTKDEEDDKLRLKRAKEFLDYSRNAEIEAIKALAEARERTKRAKEKYEATFQECEMNAVKRRKEGKIEFVSGY